MRAKPLTPGRKVGILVAVYAATLAINDSWLRRQVLDDRVISWFKPMDERSACLVADWDAVEAVGCVRRL